MAADRAPPKPPLLPVLLSLALAACAANPVTGESELALLSEQQELELGAEAHAAILRDFGHYRDPDLQAYVDAVGQPIAAASHRPHLGYTFTVLDSDIVNAMATPGYVYITRGLLALLESEAELAAVLGHESAHITARHTVQRHGRQTLSDLIIGTALAATGKSGTGAESLADLAQAAYISGYGRDQELEADALGAQYAAGAGYAPESMLTVLARIRDYEAMAQRHAAARGEAAAPGYRGLFASHPDSAERVRAALRDVPAPAGEPRIGRAEYLRRIAGMRIGADVAQGVLAGGVFHYPPMGFAVELPEGWHAANLSEHLRLSDPDSAAEFRMGLMTGLSFRAACAHAAKEFGAPLDEQVWGAHTVCAAAPGAGTRRNALLRLEADAALVFEADHAARRGAPFRALVQGVRAMAPDERAQIRNLTLAVRQARPGERYADYIPATPLAPDRAEDWLRLINGAGPKEAPAPGAAVKALALQP